MPYDKTLRCEGTTLLTASSQRTFKDVWWGRCRYCNRSIKLTKDFRFRRHQRVTMDRPAQLAAASR